MQTWLTRLTLGAIGLAVAGCASASDPGERTGASEPTVARVVGEFTMDMSPPAESGDAPGLSPEAIATVHGVVQTTSRNNLTTCNDDTPSWSYTVRLNSVTEDPTWGCSPPYWIQLDSITNTTACDYGGGSAAKPLWVYDDQGLSQVWEFRPVGGSGSFVVNGYVYANCATYP